MKYIFILSPRDKRKKRKNFKSMKNSSKVREGICSFGHLTSNTYFTFSQRKLNTQIFIAAILTSRKICCGRDSITYNFSLKIQQHNFQEK